MESPVIVAVAISFWKFSLLFSILFAPKTHSWDLKRELPAADTICLLSQS